ncbi:MAG: replicative DNA helicase [Planctomycetes bacterium]|nr:replicative DNA helicase [Planctomycetota bacterium]
MFDREPPRDLEAEMSVLGAVLLENTVADVVFQILRPEHFYDLKNRLVFQAMMALIEAGHPVDAVTCKAELERTGDLETAGGAAYLADLLARVPTAANAEHYAGIVREKALLRSLIRCATEIVKDAYESPDRPDAVVDKAQQSIFDVAGRRHEAATEDLRQVLHDIFLQIDGKAEGEGLCSGFSVLDELTQGLQPGELTVLAARPSMGKTTLALNVVEHVVLRERKAVALFSMEMGRHQVARNMLCGRARVDSHRFRKGLLSDVEVDRLRDAAGDFYEAPLYIDDTPMGLTPMELRAKARRLRAQHDIALVVVDYLQLMSCPGEENRVQEISRISRSLKGLARDLKLPVLALGQLNRGVESRESNRPRMSDLRESGSIEQDADVILLLHRASYYKHKGRDEQADTDEDRSAELIVAKQRNGPTGNVDLVFLREFMRFESLAREPVPVAPHGG